MKSRSLLRLIYGLLAWVLVISWPAFAAQAPQPHRLALVIGNADYPEAPLRNPVNDARAMTKSLQALGFEVISLENADRQAMERAMVAFTSRLTKDSAGLFYYAGHGIQARGRNYLIPVNAKLTSEAQARFDTVGVSELMEELEFAGNRLNVVILDACRNNPFERRMRGGSRGLAAIDAATGTLIAYATAPGSVARDGEGRNGVYTEELLHALAVPGLKVEEVFKQVRVNVSKRTAGQQVPWESSSLTGDFVINQRAQTTEIAAAPSVKEQAELLYWESIKDSGDVASYRAYLDQYPDGMFASLALVRIEGIQSRSSKGPEPSTSTAGSQATTGREVSEKLTIAIAPFGAPAFSGSGGNGQLHRFAMKFISKRGGVKVKYSYYKRRSYGHVSDLVGDPTDLWSDGAVHKVPIEEKIYEIGERMKVDGVLTYFHNRPSGHGQSGASYDVEVYLFDVKRRKVFHKEGTRQDFTILTKQVVGRLLKERGVVAQTQ